MTAIVNGLRTGCPWKALPRSLGAPRTVHDRFQEWRAAQVFERLWQAGLRTCDTLKGLEWEWQAMDGAMTKAPLGPLNFSDRLLVLGPHASVRYFSEC